MTAAPITAVRPKEVTRALMLLLASLGLALLKLALLPQPGSLLSALAIIGLLFWLVIAIGRGRNWARLVFLLLFLLGIPAFFVVRETLFKQGAASMAILLLQTALQAAAMVLLFLPAARPWFHRPPPGEQRDTTGTPR